MGDPGVYGLGNPVTVDVADIGERQKPNPSGEQSAKKALMGDTSVGGVAHRT